MMLAECGTDLAWSVTIWWQVGNGTYNYKYDFYNFVMQMAMQGTVSQIRILFARKLGHMLGLWVPSTITRPQWLITARDWLRFLWLLHQLSPTFSNSVSFFFKVQNFIDKNRSPLLSKCQLELIIDDALHFMWRRIWDASTPPKDDIQLKTQEDFKPYGIKRGSTVADLRKAERWALRGPLTRIDPLILFRVTVILIPLAGYE